MEIASSLWLKAWYCTCLSRHMLWSLNSKNSGVVMMVSDMCSQMCNWVAELVPLGILLLNIKFPWTLFAKTYPLSSYFHMSVTCCQNGQYVKLCLPISKKTDLLGRVHGDRTCDQCSGVYLRMTHKNCNSTFLLCFLTLWDEWSETHAQKYMLGSTFLP